MEAAKGSYTMIYSLMSYQKQITTRKSRVHANTSSNSSNSSSNTLAITRLTLNSCYFPRVRSTTSRQRQLRTIQEGKEVLRAIAVHSFSGIKMLACKHRSLMSLSAFPKDYSIITRIVLRIITIIMTISILAIHR